MDWDDDLGVGRAVAGDMARKLVDVIDELRPVIRHSGSAHAVSDLNLHAGGLALKGVKHKKSVFQQIVSCLVEVWLRVVE